MRNLRQAREDVALAADLNSVISFGGQSAQWTRLLAAWVHDFKIARPDLALRCTVDTSEALLHGVSDGSLDFAVLSNPAQRVGVRVEQLATDHIALFATKPDHGGVNTPDYILVDWGPDFLTWHAEQFPTFSTPRLQVNQVPLALRLMHNYGGACYAPVSYIDRTAIQSDVVRIAGAPVFETQLYVVYAADAMKPELDHALAALRETSKAVFKSLPTAADAYGAA
jgi:DNA-binding transcriptional LysR family regulator